MRKRGFLLYKIILRSILGRDAILEKRRRYMVSIRRMPAIGEFSFWLGTTSLAVATILVAAMASMLIRSVEKTISTK
jgi:hypothetical protein